MIKLNLKELCKAIELNKKIKEENKSKIIELLSKYEYALQLEDFTNDKNNYKFKIKNIKESNSEIFNIAENSYVPLLDFKNQKSYAEKVIINLNKLFNNYTLHKEYENKEDYCDYFYNKETNTERKHKLLLEKNIDDKVENLFNKNNIDYLFKNIEL